MALANVRLMVTPVVLTSTSGAFVASVTCDECAETDEWRILRMPPPEVLKKHFVVRGWEMRKRPRCPACVKKKEKKVTKISQITQVPVNDQPVPSDAAKRARRMVYMALEDYYDEPKKAYKAGWTDKKIADETGASEAVVASIRQQDFGPLGPPSEFTDLLTALNELRGRFEKLAHDNGWVI